MANYATEGTFSSKKAFAEHVRVNGAANVYVINTSLFAKPEDTRVSVASLAGDGTAAIVGPDAYRDRRWYANVKTKTDRVTKAQTVVIV